MHVQGAPILSGHFLAEENPPDTLAAVVPFFVTGLCSRAAVSGNANGKSSTGRNVNKGCLKRSTISCGLLQSMCKPYAGQRPSLTIRILAVRLVELTHPFGKGSVDPFGGGRCNAWRQFQYMCGRICLLYTSPSPRDLSTSRMPSSA